MRPLRPWRHSHHEHPLINFKTIPQRWFAFHTKRSCSCAIPPPSLSINRASSTRGTFSRDPRITLHENSTQKQSKREHGHLAGSPESLDHRTIGNNQSLWTHHPSSPGSPFFLPAGAHIFRKLIEFLRAQYPAYGFQEVLTPTLYKRSLWEQSGHWWNYKNDMFTVKGGNAANDKEEGEFGLKPMNCPGHCLLFASKRRSYRDLPMRYAEFSPLHRDEISGALSGLIRVRRFHQDDGHIFCRPKLIQAEVREQIHFIEMVYDVFGLKIHKVVLSTRPERDYMGNIDEWDSAEGQLKEALDNSKVDWAINPGDGAFYGPKIDVMVRGRDGKGHQTATIQLDFQMPKRFELTYASEMEAVDEKPVMIHRAIFGSVERFMALLAEHYNGRWPFWLNPNQVIVLTVSDNLEVVAHARDVAAFLRGAKPRVRQDLYAPTFSVDIDCSGDSLGKKIARAKSNGGPKYNVICVLGEKNISSNLLDLDLAGMPQLGDSKDDLASIRPYVTTAEKSTAATNTMASSKISLSPSVLLRLMKQWSTDYF